MSANKTTDHNATPLDDVSGLRGGTEGGRAGRLVDPNDTPSEAVVGNLAGSPAGHGGAGGESLETDDGSRHPSPADLAGRARDAAKVPAGVSQPGNNAGDPAAERKAGRSPGNMTHKSGHAPDDPANPLNPGGPAEGGP